MSMHHFSLSNYFFRNTQSAWLWAIVRLYLGWEWIHAGLEKLMNPAWFGSQAGTAITGFFNGSLAKTGGAHPDVQAFYANFLQGVAIPNAELFSYLIVFGEIAVGLGLILGIFTGVAAFFGAVMNFNFMFAGSVSLNPYWALMEIFLVLAWKVSGYIGLDRYVLPFFDRSRMLPASKKRR